MTHEEAEDYPLIAYTIDLIDDKLHGVHVCLEAAVDDRQLRENDDMKEGRVRKT